MLPVILVDHSLPLGCVHTDKQSVADKVRYGCTPTAATHRHG